MIKPKFTVRDTVIRPGDLVIRHSPKNGMAVKTGVATQLLKPGQIFTNPDGVRRQVSDAATGPIWLVTFLNTKDYSLTYPCNLTRIGSV